MPQQISWSDINSAPQQTTPQQVSWADATVPSTPVPAKLSPAEIALQTAKIKAGLASQAQYKSAQEQGLPQKPAEAGLGWRILDSLMNTQKPQGTLNPYPATPLFDAVVPGAEANMSMLDVIKSMLPNTARAGQKFGQVMDAAKNVPLNLQTPDDIAIRAMEIGGRGAKTPGTGSTMPKVLSDYIRQREMNLPITYETGRDFAAKAGALSADEASAIKGTPMDRQVTQFAQAMKDANREAAVKMGVGGVYDSAMKEYAQAKNLAEKAEIIKKWAPLAALSLLGAGATGAAAAKGYSLYQQLHGR